MFFKTSARYRTAVYSINVVIRSFFSSQNLEWFAGICSELTVSAFVITSRGSGSVATENNTSMVNRIPGQSDIDIER